MSNLARVYINNKPYLVELGSYRSRDLVDFSPRAATAGGSILHSELGLMQVIMQTDWRHGFGFPWWIDEAGFMKTEGFMDTRHSGIVMLGPSPTLFLQTTLNTYTIGGMGRFGTSLVAWHNLGLIRTTASSGTWADVSPVPSSKVNFGWANNTYFFAAVDGDYIYRTTNFNTWTPCGVNANSKDYAWAGLHNGYIYAGKDYSTEVYYSSKLDLNDLAGTPADDPNVIYIGVAGQTTKGMLSYMGNAYVLTDTMIYKILHEQNTATKVLDFTSELKEGSGFTKKKWVIHNSMIVLAVLHTMYQWNGVRLADITPQRIDDAWPYTTYGDFDNLTVVKTDLFCTAKTTTGRMDLLAFDGVGWHCMATDIASVMDTMYHDPYWQLLWLHGDQANYDVTKYIGLRERSRFIEAGFPITGDHYLYTSKIDAGFRRVTKSTPSILVEASNVSANTYLLVYYSIDGGAFKPWGTDGVTNKVFMNGMNELSRPYGTAGSTLEYKSIQFRIKFVTNSALLSPVLESITVRLIMRPDTNFGYSFMIVSTNNPELGTQMMDDREPTQIIADLHIARQSKAPIDFIDVFGISHKAYISALSEQAVEWKSDRPSATPLIEGRISVNLVEV